MYHYTSRKNGWVIDTKYGLHSAELTQC